MKIYIDENMPPQLAEGLSILEKPNNEGLTRKSRPPFAFKITSRKIEKIS
jgi:hypothetical protein